MKSYDNFGNIVVVKFPDNFSLKEKKKFAEKILKEQKNIKTVLEKKEKIKGRLRKLSTNYIAGEKTKEVLYKENNCIFRFNIDKTYFSPRLSNERKEIASKIKKGEIVLVMFAGVAPYSIVIAKNSKAKKVFSNEINREANKYAQLNIALNKVKDKVELIPGDIRRLVKKWKSHPTSVPHPPAPDVIVMPRPQLKETFLKEAFALSKKGTRIYYYDFCKIDEIDSVVEKIKKEAKKFKKKIKILNIKKAGELAPYKTRLRVDFIVL
jgi:tRNA (guanine37-N1)-methyltransferase